MVLFKDKKKKSLYIHRLVVTAFRGSIPPGMVVNHRNENKLDNSLSNLEIVTAKQNNNHGTRNERIGKALSKQLDLMEADWPYHEYTFTNSYIASEFFGYQRRNQIGKYISYAKKRGENYINIRGTRYIFAQEA